MKYYTGIGSRNTPERVLEQMEGIAATLAHKGYCLRSGAAPGADTAFEKGALNGDREIYLPWHSFAHLSDPSYCYDLDKLPLKEEASKMVQSITPYWSKLGRGAKSLLTRNVFQLLGQDLNTPSDFVILWATSRGNSVDGGSRIVYDLAQVRSVPTFNLYHDGCYEAIMLMIEGL